MNRSIYRPLVLIILSLAVLWSIPGTKAGPSLGSLIPPSFEVNLMAASPQGDVGIGSFYALDPTVIPWDLTNSIYKYVGVTLIVTNFNSTALSSTTGTNITSAGPGLVQYKVILIIQGVQRNAPAIVSDIQSIFGMSPDAFHAQVSNPLTLPVSVFASNFTLYSNFVNKFVALTSAKPAMIGKYTGPLLQTSSSAIIFNSLESLTYPVTPAFSSSNIVSQVLGLASASAVIGPAFGLNSTGVFVVHKRFLDFSLGQDHTLSFWSLVGLAGGITSATNETFVASMPDGAQVKSFSPSNMLVQSGTGSTLVIGAFPWVGTASRLLPDVSVTFHYPAFDSPVLYASWLSTPSSPNVGQPFNFTLGVTNTGPADAKNLHFTLAFTGLVLLGQSSFIHSLQYNLASLPRGVTDNRLFNFQSYSPSETFTLSAYYLDTQNYVYQWNTQFSLGPNVKQNGPLIVTKTVSPSSPAYGQVGNVTVTINNPSGSTYYNIEDLNPDAQIFLYPSGFENNPSQPTPCPGLANIFNPITANTTYFTFQVQNGLGYTSTVLTHVYAARYGQPLQLVASPNIFLGSGETWSPLKPYVIPGGPATLYEQLNLELTFQNYQNTTALGSVTYTTALPQQENPKTSYLGLYCSPCTITRGGTSLISGTLDNATGAPISGQQVTLSYKLSNNTVKPIQTVTTNSTGGYSYSWTGASQVLIGGYQLIANFTGSAQYNAAGVYTPISIVAPTTISPGGTITLSYPYFFNVTGTLSLANERIAYSSSVNATGTDKQLVSEYVAQSSTVPVTVGPPTILPVVDESMNVTRISFVYVAQNQSLVQVNLRVTNTGPQTATNIVVSSLIPQGSASSRTYWLPVVSMASDVTVASNLQTITFSVATLLPGQAYSTWYTVRANSTNLFTTASNVTAQAGPSQFKFYYTGPVLGVYPSPSSIKLPQQGYLQAYVTIDPAVVANKTSTTVSIHLYNAGNVTYTSIIATISSYLGSQLVFPITSKIVPNMAPGTSQTINFTATAAATSFFAGTTTSTVSGTVSYNQSSTKGFQASFSRYVLIYDPTIPNFNPSLKVDISTPTPQVSAGATDLVTVTVMNTGSSNVTNFSYNLQAYSPMFNPTGPSSPETSYGSLFAGWPDNLTPGQSVKFRIGIQTRAGGSYPVFATQVYYSWTVTQTATISATSTALITATDTTPPTVNPPWSSPFAPSSTDHVHIWAQTYDGSGIASVNLEYSTDRMTWTSVPMNSLFNTYVKGQGIPVQPFFGDIYNTTLPPLGPGAAVFYRVRATDTFGNTGLQDNSGNDYVYFIQGGNSWLFPNTSPGTNTVLNPTQYNPTVKTTLTLNVSTPIAVQIIQLPSNPGGSPPSGMSSIGLYTQVNANLSITLDARIRFYYNSTSIQGLDPNTVTPYYWDGTNWIALANVSRNPSQNYVEGTVHHFSLFGVFASPATTQPTQPVSQTTWLFIGIAIAAIIGGILGFVAKRRKHRAISLKQVAPSNPPSTLGGPSFP